MEQRKIIAIIQARMSSSRLPGKVLINIEGKSVLEHVYDRVKHAESIDEIIVATSLNQEDDAIEDLCQSKKINIFRGSLDDVLGRFYQCAKENNASHVLRITADCPMLDPKILSHVISVGSLNNFDCYGIGGSFPDGLDCTLLSMHALSEAFFNAHLDSDREHVCPYIERNPNKFKCGSYNPFSNHQHLRWTLDEERDLQFIKKIYKSLYSPDKIFYSDDILKLLSQNPELTKINSNIIRNEGYLKSLKKDNARK
jgi:spore coat polysaccharide biosynthesis protein SpsF